MDPKFQNKITELEKKYNPSVQQLTALQDIASMVHELINVADDTKNNTDHLKALGAVLDDSRQQLVQLNKKEAPEAPDYAKPVVEAVNKLSKAVSDQLSKLNVTPDVKVAAPVVNVPAPNVTVSPTDVKVDLSKIEKILKTDLPKAFNDAIAAIPVPEQDDTLIIEKLSELGQTLQDIDKATRMKPMFPTQIQVVNPDGSAIGSLSGSTVYEGFNDTTTDVNLVYLGKALPGSLTSDAAWQIKRYNKLTGHMSFADDITTFTKIWDNRSTYGY